MAIHTADTNTHYSNLYMVLDASTGSVLKSLDFIFDSGYLEVPLKDQIVLKTYSGSTSVPDDHFVLWVAGPT